MDKTEHNSVGLGQLVDGVITDNRTSINGTFFGQFFVFVFVVVVSNVFYYFF